jgi:hypothetical protein
MFTPQLLKHLTEIKQRISRFQFERSPRGLYFPAMGAIACGHVKEWANNDFEGMGSHENLVVDQGLNYAIEVALLSGGQILLNSWFLALHAGTGPVLSTWTASNYASVATEIVATSPEGYSEANRQAWAGVANTGNTSADNSASPATVTIVTATQLQVNGAALISSNVRGGTGGTLMGAVVYAATRFLGNGDSYNVQYEWDLNTP